MSTRTATSGARRAVHPVPRRPRVCPGRPPATRTFLAQADVVRVEVFGDGLETRGRLGARIAHLRVARRQRIAVERDPRPLREVGNVDHLADEVVVIERDPSTPSQQATRFREEPRLVEPVHAGAHRDGVERPGCKRQRLRGRAEQHARVLPRRDREHLRRSANSNRARSPATRSSTSRYSTRRRAHVRCASLRAARARAPAPGDGDTGGPTRTACPRRSPRTGSQVVPPASRSASFHVRKRVCTRPSGPSPAPVPSGVSRKVQRSARSSAATAM